MERINELLTHVVDSQTEMDWLSAPLSEALRRCFEIEEQQDAMWQIWSQRVIKAGTALAEAQSKYGAGWEQAYGSLGYEVSYPVACNYIACAKHPESGYYTTTLEEWAEAAVDAERSTEFARQIEAMQKANIRSCPSEASGS